MIKLINTRYLIFSLIIFAYFSFSVKGDFVNIYFLNFIVLLFYYFILRHYSHTGEQHVSKLELGVISFVYITIAVALFNTVSYAYNQNFFVFSESDTLSYHYESILMASKSFWNGIEYILNKWSYEDLGAAFIISSVYRIVESNLALNVFYIFIGVFTANRIYRISTNIMSLKYSFLCAISYSLSSFVLWFHSSGLKESFMVMLVVLFFDRYYIFQKRKNIIQILYLILTASSLIFFRPALALFCLGSLGLSILISKRKGAGGIFVGFIVTIILVFAYPLLEYFFFYYLGTQSMDQMISTKESIGMVRESILFTYGVNSLSQMIGPLPTFSSSDKIILSFYSVGLFYRVLLSVPFWFGAYYIFKNKVTILYPMLLFVLFEMASLTIILEGLELRKSLAHFPGIYIISFWFLYNYDHSNVYIQKSRIKTIFKVLSVILFGIVFYWNLRV